MTHQLPIAAIQRIVGRHYGIPRSELLGPSRVRRLAVPRQVAMVLAREFSGASLPRIGLAFGRDHSTAIHAAQSVRARAKRDAGFAGELTALRAKLSLAAELHELDCLPGRVYLAVEAQLEWEDTAAERVKCAAYARACRLKHRRARAKPEPPRVPSAPPVAETNWREAWKPGTPVPSALGEVASNELRFPVSGDLTAARSLRLADVSAAYGQALDAFEAAWNSGNFARTEALWLDCVKAAKAAQRTADVED